MMRTGIGWIGVLVLGTLGCAGCSQESLRVALRTQQRTDDVQQAVFDQQHEALCVLVYRDLVHALEGAGSPLTEAQRAALNEAWNARDLVEFWALQHERACALRIAGVDAQLAGQQSIVDLLAKQLAARADRVKEELAEATAEAIQNTE